MGDSMTLASLQHIFRQHRDRATGVWKIGTEPSRTIFFESGDVVFAQSTHPTDRLTYLLVERGKLTQAQLDYALANLKPGFSIGKNLIDMGFITQRDLLDVARLQVERIVQGALGTPDLVPSFDARELDAAVVRLPMDTPRLLLDGLLNLQDRERLLELLGPLNQVVVLQGRRVMEMGLPADLAKLIPLLDGTRTLLELGRETLAEPLRLGTFALFLREMGWARLHEMPPLDRQALDRALTAELEPLPPSAPDVIPETVPSLFSTIEDAARPTTNLEHLSQALDVLPEVPAETPQAPPEEAPVPPPLEPPVASAPAIDSFGFQAESGRAIMPTPTMELPEPPAAGLDEPEPEVTLRPSTLEAPPEAAAPPAPEPAAPKKKSGGLGLAAALVALLAALGAGGWWWLRNRPARTPGTPSPAGPAAPAPAAPGPPAPQPEPPKPEPPKPEPIQVVGTSIPERVDALRKGDLELAIKQGRKYVEEGSPQQWTLRLEIACMGDTLSKAVELFGEEKPDLFIVPMTLTDGRSCYQVFCGKFPSRGAAEKKAAGLPRAFHEAGNRPKVFRIEEIPSRQ